MAYGSPEPPRTLAKKSKRTPSDSRSPAVIFSPASAGPTPVRGGGSPVGVLPEDSIILQGYTFFVSGTKEISVKVGRFTELEYHHHPCRRRRRPHLRHLGSRAVS